MGLLLVDGVEVEAARLIVNEGLNFGRFDSPELEVHAYELRLGVDELRTLIGAEYDLLVKESKSEDEADDDPSPFARMGYPALEGAFAFPEHFAEIIRVYLDRTILAAYIPATDTWGFVINSLDEVEIEARSLSLAGRCFKRMES